MGKNLFIAEKPSVAREFARVLQLNTSNRDGYMESDQAIVTWCVGHLVTMSYPEVYDEKYKRWSFDTIPFIPDQFKYEVIDSVKKQFQIVSGLLNRADVDTIYVCTDSGREGEYIYRLVEQEAHVTGKIRKRVWIDSQTEEEIKRGIREAKDLSAYDALGAAAYLRAKEDYLMGINFSRALTLKYGNGIKGFLKADRAVVSVGRVMTCVLGMVVKREREIRDFVNSHVHEQPQEDFEELLMTPGAALRSGVCNQPSREVLAVAVARVCGIPARIREDDGTAEYRVSGSRSEKGAPSVQAEYLPFDRSRRETSCLTLRTDDEADVKYETTWGLTRLSDKGEPDQFLSLKDNWNHGRMDIPLVPGRYCLVTAQRLPNGNAHVLEYHIRAEADKKADIRLKMQQIRPEEMFVSVDMPPLHLRADNGEAVRQQNGKKRLYIWLAPGQEPTEHILNEMLDNEESYERIAPAISLITDIPAQKEQRLVRKVTDRFPSIQCCYAEDPSEREMLMRSFYLDPGQLPFIFVTDRSGHGIFSAGGYQVGTGRLLIRIMNL